MRYSVEVRARPGLSSGGMRPEEVEPWTAGVEAAIEALPDLLPLTGHGWGGLGIVTSLRLLVEADTAQEALDTLVRQYRSLPEHLGTRTTTLQYAEVSTEAVGASEAEARQLEQVGRVVVWAHHVLRHLDALEALFAAESWNDDHWEWPHEESLDQAAETHALYIALNQLGDAHAGAPGAMRSAHPLPADLAKIGDALRNAAEHNGGKPKTREAIEELGLSPGALSWSQADGLVLAGRLHLRDTRDAVRSVYDAFVLEGRRILALMRGELVARFQPDGGGALRRVG